MAKSHYREIKPQKGFLKLDLKEIWEFKDLLYFFSWRDIKVRYKQTIIGIVWAVLQPFVTMIIFSIFFGNFAKMRSDGIPYPIFVFTGLIFWNLFSSSLASTSTSIISFQGMIKKIYFPRVILPVSTVITNSIDFLIAAVIFWGMIIFYQYTITLGSIVIFFVMFILTLLAAIGPGLFFASFNVRYRDVRYVLPFIIKTLMFLTPVIYPVSIFNESTKYILALNPMTGIIQTMRDVMFGMAEIDVTLLVITFIVTIVYIIFGLLYFKRTEKSFADLI